MNRTLKRPMFRIGGSAGTGITSGLDKPRQGYKNAGMAEIVKQTRDSLTPEVLAAYQPYFERPKGEGFNRFLMSTGLNLMSATPKGKGLTGLFSTAAEAAKQPTAQLFKDIDEQRIGKRAAEADLFKTLLEGNIGIAESAVGNEGSAKTYERLEIAKALRKIMPRYLELKNKKNEGTLDVEAGEDVELRMLQEDYNSYSKKDVGQELLMEIYVKGKGERYLPNKIEELYKRDLQGERKYTSPTDPQIEKDAIEEIKREINSLAAGGRAGYQMGGGIDMAQAPMSMPQEPMTTAPGPIDDGSNNLISYDQLRARLPAEITDDIVELMTSSAEALEDFAMISTQQDVNQFNKKYSVNLVLPAEA